jgi:hypothetical protein
MDEQSVPPHLLMVVLDPPERGAKMAVVVEALKTFLQTSWETIIAMTLTDVVSCRIFTQAKVEF